MKRFICVLMIACVALISSSCGFFSETGKDIESAFLGGLNREITVYTANGDVIAKYRGRIDIKGYESGNYVEFTYEGRRIAYYNCCIESVEILDEDESADNNVNRDTEDS